MLNVLTGRVIKADIGETPGHAVLQRFGTPVPNQDRQSIVDDLIIRAYESFIRPYRAIIRPYEQNIRAYGGIIRAYGGIIRACQQNIRPDDAIIQPDVLVVRA
jgi:hypothetical protein